MPDEVRVCNKKGRYSTRAIAKTVMKKMNKDKKNGKKFTTPHYCDYHDCWHLTTMSKQGSRDLGRHLRNKKNK